MDSACAVHAVHAGYAPHDYAQASSKPLLVLEYGVDAYDMRQRGENEELQAEWTRRLARELEANAATCESGCASNVSSGGTIMSWVDEFYKGHLNTNACAQGSRTPGYPRCDRGWESSSAVSCIHNLNPVQCRLFWQGTEEKTCPDWDASHHSACGTFQYGGQPDDWLNEEWWGVVALVPCASAEPTVRPRRIFYELKLLWRLDGGCVVQQNATGIAPPYDADAYPHCGENIAAAAANVSAIVSDALYKDNGVDITHYSVLPGAAALEPPSSPPASPGSLTHLLGVQLNHTASLLADLPGNITLGDGSPEANAVEEATMRFGNATCLALLAASFLRDNETDGCPYQDYVACLDAGACPRRKPFDMEAYLQRQRVAQTAGDCPPAAPPATPPQTPPPPPQTPAPLQRLLRGNRMSVYGRELRLDGETWMMRGICYSPVPVGHDPGYAEPRGDYFTSTYRAIFARDIELMVQMGANTIRLYTFKRSRRHADFLDLAYERRLVVVGAFEMGSASQTPLNSTLEVEKAKMRLREQIRASWHPALVMWLVGNELNGGWHLFVCDPVYANDHHAGSSVVQKYGGCMFGDNPYALGERIDQLCATANEEGMLCSTPLAGVSLPSKYMGWDREGCTPSYTTCPDWPDQTNGCAAGILRACNAVYGGLGWIKLLEPLMRNVDLWAINMYPGKNYTGWDWDAYEAYASKPIIVSEYGIDAYDADAEPESNLYRNVSDIDMAGSNGHFEGRSWVRKEGEPGVFKVGMGMACAWHVHGTCMACARHVHGTCTARAQRAHGMRT